MFMIETLAGSDGQGPATMVAQAPNALAVTGETMYVCDGLWSVIRVINLGSGHERVVATGLAEPVDVAADVIGNLFICDYANHRILKLNTFGIISTVAGTGVPGFSGDGAQATAAKLNTPNGVFADAGGDLFIADTNNARIRRVDSDGKITTVAGSGHHGYSGDGGRATAAMLNAPSGVHLDNGGNLYIADTANHCIRCVDLTGAISTVAGVGSAGYSGDGGAATSGHLNSPFGVFVNPQGVLYVPDFGNHRLRRIALDGTITTVAGAGVPGFAGDGGPAVEALLRGPTEVGEDPDGNLYISDLGNRRVRCIAPDGSISTVAGNGTSGFSGDGGAAQIAQLLQPGGIAVDESGVYIADTRNHRIRKIDQHGIITTSVGNGTAGFTGDGGAAISAALNQPMGVVLDGAGNILFTDKGNHRVRRVDATGRISTIVGNGTSLDTSDGATVGTVTLNGPTGLALDQIGKLWIADSLNHRILRVNLDETVSLIAGVDSPGYSGDGGSAIHAHLNSPLGIVLAKSGDLYVADRGNHRIRRVDSHGIITTIAGNGSPGFDGDGGPAKEARLHGPSGLALDHASNLYVIDSMNHRIRKVDTAGTITTIAGDGTSGLSGDAGPAIFAHLRFSDDPRILSGISVDKSEALYVADAGNNRVRRLAATASSSTSPAPADVSAVSTLSSPAAFTLDGVVRVIYRGRDRHIHELFFDERINVL